MPDEDSHDPSGRPGPQLLATERVMALRGLRAPSTEKAVGEEERLPKWDGHVNVYGGVGDAKGAGGLEHEKPVFRVGSERLRTRWGRPFPQNSSQDFHPG